MENLEFQKAGRFVAASVLAGTVLLVISSGVRPAHAQTRTSITSLFSTGVSGTGTSLAASVQDTHYRIISDPSGGSSVAAPTSLFVTAADGFPIGPWMDYSAGNGASRWVEPGSGTTDTHAAGTYLFRTSFSLVNYQASSAQINLRVAVDNDISEVRVNGVAVTGTSASGFATFTNLPTISSANATFLSGTNTIDFVVVNGTGATSNPTGLRVEATGTAFSTIPEPATFSFVFTGLAVVGGGAQFARRRRQTSQAQ